MTPKLKTSQLSSFWESNLTPHEVHQPHRVHHWQSQICGARYNTAKKDPSSISLCRFYQGLLSILAPTQPPAGFPYLSKNDKEKLERLQKTLPQSYTTSHWQLRRATVISESRESVSAPRYSMFKVCQQGFEQYWRPISSIPTTTKHDSKKPTAKV